MRAVCFIPAIVAAFLSTAVSAQVWEEFVSREDFFQVNFPGELITDNELQYATISTLVPISPDGRWAAYTKRFDYSDSLNPAGHPVHIVKLNWSP